MICHRRRLPLPIGIWPSESRYLQQDKGIGIRQFTGRFEKASPIVHRLGICNNLAEESQDLGEGMNIISEESKGPAVADVGWQIAQALLQSCWYQSLECVDLASQSTVDVCIDWRTLHAET
jgi:hypothetical protein